MNDTLPMFDEVAMPPVDADFLRKHRPSRWRSFTTDQEVLRCCGQDFGPVAKRQKKGAPDAWDQWADHVAAASCAQDHPGSSDPSSGGTS